MESWYFETSALNEFAKDRSVQDAIATKAFQNVRGRKWITSPVTFWEIMLTSDELQKEKLIYFSQHLLDRELLPSPEEILVEYIDNGFPAVEKPRPLISNSGIAATWRDLVDIPDKTFIYDKEEMKSRVAMLKPINKTIHQIMNGEDVPLMPIDTKGSINATLEGALNNLQFIKNDGEYDQDSRKIFKLAIFYMMLILCAEVGFENNFIKQFWIKHEIDSTEDRIHYALKNFEPLIYRGPLAAMATMAFCQSKLKFSRGVFFDSLHAFYLTYVERFFTCDDHFKDLREELGQHPNASKIIHFDEVELSHHERDGNEVKSSIIT